MARPALTIFISFASLVCANCAGPDEVAPRFTELAIRVSVTRIPAVAGYVHVLAANLDSIEFTWEIANARYSDVASGENCEPTMRRTFSRVDDSQEPGFSLHSLVTLKPGQWQARTLPIPEELLGVGCVLDVALASSIGGKEFARRHIEVPLIEGFFEPLPQPLLRRPFRQVASEFVPDHGWYLIRVLAQAPKQMTLSVDWPDAAICSDGTSSVPLEVMPLISLPGRSGQRVAKGQWATAGIVLSTRDGSAPPLETCAAELGLNLAVAEASSSTRLFAKLARQPSTRLSSFVWSGCPGCSQTLER